MRRLLVIVAALLSLAVPAAAQAAGSTVSTTVPASALSGSTSPFAVGVPQSSAGTTTTATTPTVATTSTSSSTTGSFSTLDVVLIAAGVGLVIAGTWIFVLRDARKTARHLRGGKSAVATVGGARPGSKPAPRPRKLSAAEKKRRKRGKAPRRR